MKIYVAGSSADLLLVSSCMRRLRAAGYTVTHDWTEHVTANATEGRTDGDLSAGERNRYACADLDGIDRADVVWLLAPREGSAGAWVEFGYAIGVLKCTVVSGAYLRTIFTERADFCADDHETALRWIVAK